MRIGIDVGGTNTDAVLMEKTTVVAKIKTVTTADVTTGIITALDRLLNEAGVDRHQISAVMIGTTHFTNAIVERNRLTPTAVMRLGLPATQSVEPYEDWPDGLRQAIGGYSYLLHGGNESDGRVLSPLDEDEVRTAVRDMLRKGVRSVAVAAVFSPINGEMERRAAGIITDEAPGLAISLSHEIGRLGLLERENATAMNACLRDLATTTLQSFQRSLDKLDIHSPLYLTQNDGTLMRADHAQRFPVLTFASGPTNSMRGAAFLSGLKDGLIVDIGGTTTDVGALSNGFPREASVTARIGGVFTNFRMPDLYSFGLGGGSLVHRAPLRIGPDSVGYQLAERALVFGGETLTATDIAVAAGLADIGDPGNVASLDRAFIDESVSLMQAMVEEAIDRIKLSAAPEPVILVGGGSVLIRDTIEGASTVIRPEHYEVANAVGAAIAQISGEVDKIYSLNGLTREGALEQARGEATSRAIAGGAEPDSVHIVEVEDIPLTYLEGNLVRIRVKAVGELAS
jgi:N-methylhydantoinase A/oxoprolinase/acetone carboxylase beta subunit